MDGEALNGVLISHLSCWCAGVMLNQENDVTRVFEQARTMRRWNQRRHGNRQSGCSRLSACAGRMAEAAHSPARMSQTRSG